MCRPNSDIVELRSVTKRYGRTLALDEFSIELRAGEVLGIAGPNGAGKSTLAKIIAGEEKPTSGQVFAGDRELSQSDCRDIVAVVHQEPELFPNLSVAQNLMVGRENRRWWSPRIGQLETDLIESFGLGPVMERPLGDCTVATQQRVEIVRAVARSSQVILFDEPNSALTEEESREMFRVMRDLAERGHAIALITHRLDDLVRNCNRVVIVRDGTLHSEIGASDSSEEEIARRMVEGSPLENVRALSPHKPDRAPPVPIEIEAEPHRSLMLASGEIVALMGVEGSGAREILRAVAERNPGAPAAAGGPYRGMFAAYVPASRRDSLFDNYSVQKNLLVRLGVPEIANAAGLLNSEAMQRMGREAMARFHVKADSPDQPIRSLSGGNQQKVAIAQALMTRPRILVLEEPTRGVDVGARAEIYRLLREFADDGNAVMLFCTEVLEVHEVADRVGMVVGGRIVGFADVSGFHHVETLAAHLADVERGASQRETERE